MGDPTWLRWTTAPGATRTNRPLNHELFEERYVAAMDGLTEELAAVEIEYGLRPRPAGEDRLVAVQPVRMLPVTGDLEVRTDAAF